MTRHPIYWIQGPWKGALAIVPCPYDGADLAGALASWREHQLHTIVSLLAREEMRVHELAGEGAACEAQGLAFISFPIPDQGVPKHPQEFLGLTDRVLDAVHAGEFVGLHCRQGIGRSPMLAVAILIRAGIAPAAAFRCVTKARGHDVPGCHAQQVWVEQHIAADHPDSPPAVSW